MFGLTPTLCVQQLPISVLSGFTTIFREVLNKALVLQPVRRFDLWDEQVR
jgi:hypothetical protein